MPPSVLVTGGSSTYTYGVYNMNMSTVPSERAHELTPIVSVVCEPVTKAKWLITR